MAKITGRGLQWPSYYNAWLPSFRSQVLVLAQLSDVSVVLCYYPHLPVKWLPHEELNRTRPGLKLVHDSRGLAVMRPACHLDKQNTVF